MKQARRISLVATLFLLGGLAARVGAAPDPRFDEGRRVAASAPLVGSAAAEYAATGAVGSPAPVAAAPAEPAERRIVVFAKGVPAARRLELARAAGGAATVDLWLIGAVSAVAAPGSLGAFEAAMASRPEVLRLEKDPVRNWLLPAPGAPGRTDGAPKSAESLPWNILRVHAPDAWPRSTGAGVKVAVVDTGIDLEHRALIVDGGFNAFDPQASYADDEGHGTHVAGIVAAQDVGAGVIGVAPGARLFAVKVLAKDGGGTYTSIIAGLQWCVAHRMDVANMSFGADAGSAALADAVRAAADAGLTLVAAAGNSGGNVVFPAAYPEVIAVGATDMQDHVPDWSSRGPQVAFAAPGVEIRSTFIDGEYAFKDGTSMAAPHVTGLAALVMAAQGTRGDAVRGLLTRAATALPQAAPESQGSGMIDARGLVGK